MLSSLLLYYVFKNIFIDLRFVSDHFRILSLVLVFKFTYLHFSIRSSFFLGPRSTRLSSRRPACSWSLFGLILFCRVLSCLVLSSCILSYLLLPGLFLSDLILPSMFTFINRISDLIWCDLSLSICTLLWSDVVWSYLLLDKIRWERFWIRRRPRLPARGVRLRWPGFTAPIFPVCISDYF